MGKALLPFDVRIAQDARHAFEIVRSDKLGMAVEAERNHRQEAVLMPSPEDVDKLVALIGSINWEDEGIEIDFEGMVQNRTIAP
jgi:hypothetical protein